MTVRRKNAANVQQTLLSEFFRTWYENNGRSFPWRGSSTSVYEILLAEMLLRQTQATTVVPVWNELRQRYPNPSSLATADWNELHDLLLPLGFGVQRTTALTQMAVYLVRVHHGRVPRSLEQLLAVPHVGPYAAHAVLCFALRKRVPIVDTNVLRVFSRLYGFDLGTDNRRSPLAWRLAWDILPKYKFRQHNLGLLDFALQICTARNPKHAECPLQKVCSFYQQSSGQHET